MTPLAGIPVKEAFEFRGALAADRAVVGALGFAAFIVLLKGGRRQRLVALMLASAAVVFALVISVPHAGNSIPASVAALAVAGVTAGLVGWWPGKRSVVERVIYALAVVAGCLAITNFLVFHNWGSRSATTPSELRFSAVNYNDMFHYYLGAKYAPELGYGNLYVCVVEAGTEQGLVDPRQLARDLATNRMETAGVLLEQGASCKARFTAQRWQAFSRDVGVFLDAAVGRPGVEYIVDSGYNATPFDTTINRLLVRWTHASPTTLGALALVDAFLFVTCIGLLSWAFGPAAGALSALSWGVGYMWVTNHVGLPGSLGRLWWITALVAGVSLAKRGRFGLAGVALAVSVGFRAFPVVFLIWPALMAAGQLLRTRTISGELRRLLAGAAIGGVICGVISVIGVNGPIGIYLSFMRNSHRLMAAITGNFMGLDRMLQFAPVSAWWTYAVALALAATAACRKLDLASAIVLSGLCGMFIVFPMSDYYYVAAVLLVPLVLSGPARSQRIEVFAFGVFVLIGNVTFAAMPLGQAVYVIDSILVFLTLGFFAVRWFLTKPRRQRQTI